MYAGGSTSNVNSFLIAGYWKNGTWIALADDTTFSEILSLVVIGNDVYAGGYIIDNGNQSYDRYWKNGTWKALSDGKSDAMVNSIVVDKWVNKD